MITAQGGDARVCDDVELLPKAPVLREVPAPSDGYLVSTDCMALGYAAQHMGAGRAAKDDVIDPAVGFEMHKRIGDRVCRGESLCTVHARTEESAKQAEKEILDALTFPICHVRRRGSFTIWWMKTAFVTSLRRMTCDPGSDGTR